MRSSFPSDFSNMHFHQYASVLFVPHPKQYVFILRLRDIYFQCYKDTTTLSSGFYNICADFSQYLTLFLWRKISYFSGYFYGSLFVFVFNNWTNACLDVWFDLFNQFFSMYPACGFLVFLNRGYETFNSLGNFSVITSLNVTFNPIHLIFPSGISISSHGKLQKWAQFFSHLNKHTFCQGYLLLLPSRC